MSSSSQSQHPPANASDSKSSQQQGPSLPSASAHSASLLPPISASAMPNAQFASNIGSPNRFSNMSEWNQPQHPRYPYPYPFPVQQFPSTSYSGQSMLPPSYSGQSDMGLMPSSHVNRDQAVALLDKFSPPNAFASPNFDPVSRSVFSPSLQASRQQQQLQFAQMNALQQQQHQPQFQSAYFTQLPLSIPTSQPAFHPSGSATPFMNEAPALDEVRRTASVRTALNSASAAAAYLREQELLSMGLSSSSSSSSNNHPVVLNTSVPADPRAPSITASTHTISYSHIPSYPAPQGVMASQDLASFAKMFGARPNHPHEWLTDSTAPPGIAVTQGPFITSLDTKVPLPLSPATASSASLASPATANTSISSSLDGYEAPSGPVVAVRSSSGASSTPLSSPSTSSPHVSPKHSGAVAGGKRGREESLLSLSQSEHELDSRHLLFPQKPLSLSSLSSRSNPVSPSVSSSSVARVPTPSGALTQSFTTISLSSVAPSDAPSDPSSYLFQRPSVGLSVSSSTASLPECVSINSLIFNSANQYMGSSSQLPINLDDTLSEGNTSPSKKIKSGPAASPSPSSLSLPSSSSFTPSGVPSLTWPAHSPASRPPTAPTDNSSSAYPFNAVPTNRPSKKGGKAEPKGPKNPRSAYVYFVADQRKKLARTETLANSTFQEVASALGARWRALSPEDRRPFEEMARRDKERYQNEKSRSFEDM